MSTEAKSSNFQHQRCKALSAFYPTPSTRVLSREMEQPCARLHLGCCFFSMKSEIRQEVICARGSCSYQCFAFTAFTVTTSYLMHQLLLELFFLF